MSPYLDFDTTPAVLAPVTSSSTERPPSPTRIPVPFPTDCSKKALYPSAETIREDATLRPEDPVELYGLADYYDNRALMLTEGRFDGVKPKTTHNNGDQDKKALRIKNVNDLKADCESALHKRLRCANTVPAAVALRCAGYEMERISSVADSRQKVKDATPSEYNDAKLGVKEHKKLRDAVQQYSKDIVSLPLSAYLKQIY
jgi:hypothetical protein